MKVIIIFVVIYLVFSFLAKLTKTSAQKENKPHYPLPEPEQQPSAEATATKEEDEDFSDIFAPEPEQPESKPAPSASLGMDRVMAQAEAISPAIDLSFMAGPSIGSIPAPVTDVKHPPRRLTPGKVREGIILAEILGPCLANRRLEQQPGNF
jgi:hypothetical protein